MKDWICSQCGNWHSDHKAQMTNREFKPCPFCGGTDIRCDAHPFSEPYRSEKTVYSMCCYQCGATFPNRFKRELLVEAWNRRTDIR